MSSSSVGSEPILFKTLGPTLFHAVVTHNNADNFTRPPSSSKLDANSDVTAAGEHARQFCFVWPQFPSDLYMYNTAQLVLNPVGGGATDDAGDYWLDVGYGQCEAACRDF